MAVDRKAIARTPTTRVSKRFLSLPRKALLTGSRIWKSPNNLPNTKVTGQKSKDSSALATHALAAYLARDKRLCTLVPHQFLTTDFGRRQCGLRQCNSRRFWAHVGKTQRSVCWICTCGDRTAVDARTSTCTLRPNGRCIYDDQSYEKKKLSHLANISRHSPDEPRFRAKS